MTDLEQLQAALKAALERHADDVSWLEQGATFDHSKLELERALAESEDALKAAQADLKAYLVCAGPASHEGLHFERQPYGDRVVCYCNDCIDFDSDENGTFYTGTVGRGATESEALADYWEQAE